LGERLPSLTAVEIDHELAAMLKERFAGAMWWMLFYPVWTLTYIFVGVLVIYGLAAYGVREVTRESQTR
jgi:hypothetical protein